MIIRTATEPEFDDIRAFYLFLTDAMEHAAYSPGWKKGIYPSDEDLQRALRDRTLFVGTDGGEIVAVMVMNHDCAVGYETVNWQIQATPEEVTFLHMLGIHPAHRGKGLAKELITWAIGDARRRGQKAIRLDVLAGNLPAERLYPSVGFRHIASTTMYYPDTGWTEYELFEYLL